MSVTDPVVVDRRPWLGIFPMTRAWYDCGNGYGVSAVFTEHSVQVAAGLWMDRRPPLWWRLLPPVFRPEITLLHDTGERVHVLTDDEALAVVEYVAALPPLGVIVPERLLPACTFWWCVQHESPCTYGAAP